MEHDIYDSLRLTATTCEKIADVLNAIAECFEKVTACLMDLIEEIKRQPLKMILQKLRPDYKDKCKIRWLDIPNKVMQGESGGSAAGNRIWDGIWGWGSYGFEQRLIEVMGTQALGHDDVEGWLTARQVTKMWRCRNAAKNR